MRDHDDTPRLFHFKRKLTPYRSAIRISLIYLMYGVVWILTTDQLLEFMFGDASYYHFLQTIKGWIYVLITAILLYVLVVSTLDLYEEAKKKIEVANLDLQRQLLRTTISEQRFELAVKGSFDSIWEYDGDEKKYFMSRTLLRNLGYGEDEAKLTVLEDWVRFIVPQDREEFLQKTESFIAHPSETLEMIYRVHRADGSIAWIRTHGTAQIEDGKIVKVAGSHTDITLSKNYEEELTRLAYYHSLTGLLNWHGFAKKIQDRIHTQPHTPFTLLYLDIDDFKNINDFHGYSVGDRMLVEIANDMSLLVEDPEVVANLGGDGFGFLIETVDPTELTNRIASIYASLRKLRSIDGQWLDVSACIGIAQYPKDDQTFDDLMQSADEAMYEAKSKGKNTYVFFSDALHDSRLHSIALTNELRKAVDNDELYMMYQPIYTLSDCRVASMEALVRWKPTGRDHVPPDTFIPLAETTGLIGKIELWVFESVFKQVIAWRSVRHQSVPIAINLSSRGIADDEFVRKIIELLKKYEIKNGEIEIEITETGLIENYEAALHNLRILRSNGVKILLDDFGKGYSSLTYLVSLPIDLLKIDRGFTSRIHSSNEIDAVIATIVSLAHSINLEVIAEGIEYENQLEYLAKLKTDYGQGYHLHKPALPEIVEKLLK
ncbi:MAG: putative bifunctional diguanylate cyclase/phosphodiesterase [Erysipelotrichaceae bacterium]